MTIPPEAKAKKGSKGRRTRAARTPAQRQFQAGLLDQLGDAVIAVDQDERITYLNRAAVAQYGIDPAAAIGQPLSYAYRYEWLQPEDELLADAALAQEGRWHGENRHICQDGSSLHVESLVTVLHDAAGNATGMVATLRDITDRKQVERTLRASELRYRRLADTMPQLVWTADATGHTDYYNIHIHDFDASVWQGATGFDWASLLHPDDRATTLAAWRQAVTHRQPYTCEHRLHMADGNWRWHLSRAVLLQAPDLGLKWYGTATDIHDRKLAEEALHANQDQLKFHASLLDYAYDAVVATDAEQKLTAWNRGAEEMYGWLAAEVLGRKAYEVTQSNITPAIRAEALLQMAESGRCQVETTTYHRDGTPLLVEGHNVAMRDAAGRITGYMSISRDIRKRKADEEALRASEARFRTLASTVPSIIWTAATDGTITYANDQWFEYCGVTPEANARHWPQLVLHPDDVERCVTQWSAALASGKPYEIEVRNRRYDGVYRWFLTRASPLRDLEGHITAWFGVTTDIEERKQAELAQQFLFDLDAQLRLLDEVAAILATTTERLGHYLGVTHCTVNEIDLAADQGVVLAHWRRRPDLPRLTGAHAIATHVGGAIAEVLAAGQSIAVADVATDARTAALVPLYQRIGVQSIMRAPFRVKGTLLAVLSVADEHPRSWQPQEVRLVETVIARIWPLIIKARAEEQLYHSEERLRLATQAGGVGIFDHDLITNQTVVSELYAQLTGLPTDTMVTHATWLACVHPEDRPLVEGIWQAAQATGASYYYECRLIHPDGALVWIEVNAWVTPDEAGRGIRITGAVRDITERKQAALHQQFLLNLSSALRTLTDTNTIQQTVVEQLGEYLGADRCRFNAVDLAADKSTLLAAWSRGGLPPPSDINPLSTLASAAYIASAQAGRTLAIGDAHQDERNEIAKALLLAHGFAATIRVPCLRKGQWVASLHVLQTMARQWRPDEVQLVESVVHHFWPLVEKARIETELRRQEEFLRQIADNVPGLVGYLGADERYRFVNATFEEWFQQPRQQILGCTVAELIGREERSRLADYRQQALAGTRVSYETDFAYPDGVTRTVWGRYQPDVAADGHILGFYLFLMDITERKQAEGDARFLADLAELIRLAEDAGQLIPDAVQMVGDYLQVGRCLWIELDERQERGAIHAQHCRGLPPVAVTYTQADYSPLTRAELAAGHVLVNHDAQSDSRTAAFYETVYAPQQERAYVGVPILHEGEWRGILSITVPTARQWQPREIHLLETVAERVWLAVEKLQLNAEVQRMNERFILAEAAVPGWIYDYDWRAGTVTRSDGFQRVLGYAPEECQSTAQWWQSLIHPEDWQWLARETGPMIPRGDLRLLEYRVRDRNGHYHHIWDRARVIRDETGAVIRLVGSSVDITERKGAEAALQQSNAILSGVLESSNDAIFVRDLTGRYLLVNTAGAEQTGLPKAAIIGRRYQDLFAPAVVAAMTADDQPVFAQGLAVTLEHVSEQHGVTRYWHTLKMPLRNADGAIIGLISSARDFTERKTTEVALRASEARFRHLAEAMPQIVWTCHADGSMTYINQQWQQYSGLTLATTLAEGMWPAIHPADQAANREQWRQALVSGAAYQGEIRLRRHDGVYCWFLERAIPVHDEAGVLAQWFGVSMDIDERKRQERHQQFLSDLGMDLRLLSDSAMILTQLVERLGDYLQVASCRVNEVDLAQEQFTLQKDWVAADAPWSACATPSVYPLTELAAPPIIAALQAGETVVVANTLRDPRTASMADHYEQDQVHSLIGVPIFYQGQWRATLSVKGHGERHWRPDEVVLLESVAAQLSALLEKVRAEEALRQSEERLRLALAGGGMGIWESQVATNRSLWSPEEYALFGLPVGVEITNELFDRLIHPDDLAGLQAAMQHLFSGGGDHMGEFRLVRPDGAVRWLADRVTVLRDDAGAPVRLLGINFDITERKEQERALQELNATLEARVRERTKALEEAIHALAITNQELAQFTTAAAHDLRTPLRGIANLVQWLQEDAAAVLPPASQRHLDKLGGRVGRLEKMLEDLLLYSRVGRVRYLPEGVDVQQLLHNLLDLLAPPPGFVVKHTTPLPTFSALRIPLELVCRNLLSNAIRHHHDPANGLVEIGVRDLGEWYEFCISDNGPGIDPQFHDRIFGMFQTLKPRDQVEGSGIGLALVKKTVESVGGRVWMTSTLGQGTTFYFIWPKEQKED